MKIGSWFLACVLLTSTLAIQVAYSAENNKFKNPEATPINTRQYGERFIEMEKKLLSSIPVRKNELKSGVYILEYQFPDKKVVSHEVKLLISEGVDGYDGYIVSGPDIITDTNKMSFAGNLWVENSAVYWVIELPREEEYPYHHFVGVIDGIQIWGHVYRVAMGNDTWHPTSFALGIFTLKPKE